MSTSRAAQASTLAGDVQPLVQEEQEPKAFSSFPSSLSIGSPIFKDGTPPAPPGPAMNHEVSKAGNGNEIRSSSHVSIWAVVAFHREGAPATSCQPAPMGWNRVGVSRGWRCAAD